MRQTIGSAFAAAFLLAPLSIAVAQSPRRATPAPTPAPAVVAAPAFCPEGKTASGTCVNPVVARMGRQAAIAFTQAQISITEHPYPASADTTYAYPFNVAAAPSFLQRETLFGAFGTQGAFEIRNRGH